MYSQVTKNPSHKTDFVHTIALSLLNKLNWQYSYYSPLYTLLFGGCLSILRSAETKKLQVLMIK